MRKEHAKTSLKAWQGYIRRIFRVSHPRHEIRFLWLGALIGLAAAILAIIFRDTIEFMTIVFFGARSEGVPFWTHVQEIPWYFCLTPVAIGAFVPWFTGKYAPEAAGHGVPEIMAAVTTKRGIIRPRVTLVKLIGSALSIGSGFSVGREGPTALIGATLGSWVGRSLRFPIQRMKMAVGCGAAAGIAATFNAPLGGTAFAMELIIGSFGVRHLTPIIMSAMIATVVTHNYYGEFHELFSRITYTVKHPIEIVSYAILGTLTGLLGCLFTKALYQMEDRFDSWEIPNYVKGALGGVGISALLLSVAHLTGPATWDAIHMPLTDQMTGKLAIACLLLALAKIFATALSLASGASGGVFAPSILIGGLLGVAYGFAVGLILPEYTEAPSGYAIVGMGAFVAGVTQAPLAAVAIIFEMTNNNSIILPLIVACGMSLVVYNHFMDGSIYTTKLKRRNINIEWGRETGVLENLFVEKVYTSIDEYFYEDAPLNEVVDALKVARRTTLPVIDQERQLKGLVSFWDIRDYARNPESMDGKVARDVMQTKVYTVTPRDNLYRAFALISHGDFDYLPVVSDRQQRKLIGGLSRQRVLEAYKNQLTLRGIIEGD